MKHVGRKLYHLIGGLGLLSVYHLAELKTAFVIYSVLFFGMLIFEIVRFTVPSANQFLFNHLRSFLRQREEKRPTGMLFYILGVSVSLFLFDPFVASTAIAFLAFGDVAATTIGERYGKTKIGDKSLEGTAGFIAASIAGGLLFYYLGIGVSPGRAVAGAFAAAAVELLPIRINDNLAIPLIAGAFMQFLF